MVADWVQGLLLFLEHGTDGHDARIANLGSKKRRRVSKNAQEPLSESEMSTDHGRSLQVRGTGILENG